MMNSVETPSKEYLNAIEGKLVQFQLETCRDSEQSRPIDDDEDETVSYEQYSQYREEQEQLEREYIERTGSQ